ncbi:MAG: ATP-dependent sacrificial sulfur transferase LarE [Gemmatimonadetes bacterium]|nr:ATP-dependent sacrificial sulfur transferase LarE [Gemmatimonadota bacterium]
MASDFTAEQVIAVLQEGDRDLAARFTLLLEVLRGCGSVCIGYSGGVDSVLLAQAALLACGPGRVLAVTGLSASVSDAQRELARDCARRMGLPHLEVGTEELSDPSYAANPADRCYFCKRELWSRLAEVAAARGLSWVLDGSNADDVGDYRPGMRAAQERAIRAPLLEAGLTKADIRIISRLFGLPTWDQPSAPCLASRLPYGLAVTPERLRQVEEAESALRRLGLRDLRVRHHGDAARLELGPRDLATAGDRPEAIAAGVRAAGFRRILLDVEGYRRGALNESLTQLEPRRRDL